MNKLQIKNKQNYLGKKGSSNINSNKNDQEDARHKTYIESNQSYCLEKKSQPADFEETKNELEDIFARTFIQNRRQSVNTNDRNRSCIQFKKEKIRAKVSNFMNRQDEQQQADEQSQQKKIRKHSHSFHRHHKRIDSAIAQSLQERIQHYCYQSKLSKAKSQSSFQAQSREHVQKGYPEMISWNKLVLWTQSKLEKVIQQFYNFISAKPKFNGLIKNYKKEGEDRLLIQTLKIYLMQRFKTEKLSKQNFINLTYSLQIHIKKSLSEYSNNLRPTNQLLISKIRYWKIFDRILSGQYDYEDIMFYLYVKDLFKQTIQTKYSGKMFFEINDVALKDFLNLLTNFDPDLVNYYLVSFKKVLQRNLIDRESILQFILNDFKVKKEYMKRKAKEEKHKHSINQARNKYKKSFDKAYWCGDSFFRIKGFPFLQKVKNELERQCNRMVSIICNDLTSQDKEIILRFIIAKASKILYVLSHQSRQEIYKQYGVEVSQRVQVQNEQIIYEVQKLRNQAKRLLDMEKKQEQIQLSLLSKFLKELLVCKPFLTRLQKLIDSFQTK